MTKNRGAIPVGRLSLEKSIGNHAGSGSQNHNNNNNDMKPIKIHLTHFFTKRDIYGNVYHVVEIQNLANGKSFKVRTPSLSNITSILYDAFGGGWDNCRYIVSERCTDSARISSLPDALGDLNPCSFEDSAPYKGSWKKELNKIGFRLPKAKAEAA